MAEQKRPSRARILRGVLAQVVAAAALLALAAGRLDWLWAGLFLALFAALTALAYLVVLPADPGLAAERSSGRREAAKLDRGVAGLMSIFLPVALLVVAGLGERFAWPPALPTAVRISGAVIAVLGYLFTLWALAANTFFSNVMRIQEERGHRVVSDGPYRFVRHPGYAGFLVFWVGTALMLGSLWSLIPVALLAAATAHRSLREEETLREGLVGYVDYADRVRFRLVPGIW
jgi:protein-S-isoprenylcysteine O-methyltransferase Ste14